MLSVKSEKPFFDLWKNAKPNLAADKIFGLLNIFFSNRSEFNPESKYIPLLWSQFLLIGPFRRGVWRCSICILRPSLQDQLSPFLLIPEIQWTFYFYHSQNCRIVMYDTHTRNFGFSSFLFVLCACVMRIRACIFLSRRMTPKMILKNEKFNKNF